MVSQSRRIALNRVLSLLSKRDKNILKFLGISQLILNFLDLIGIALLGALGTLAVNGIQSKSPTGQINNLIRMLQLDSFSIQGQVAVLGVVASGVLLTRTLISVFLSRITFRFLAKRAASISSDLTNSFFSQDYSRLKAIDSQNFLYASNTGIYSIFTGVIGMLLSIFVDTTLLVIVLIGLLVLDPFVAIATLVLFGLTALMLHQFSHSKAKDLGIKHSELDLAVSRKVLQTIGAFREIRLRNGMSQQLSKISTTREELASVIAKTSFLPNVSKYVLETVVIVAALVITAFEFAISDATQAVSTLTIFLSAGARLGPAVMRIQQSIIQFEVCVGLSSKSLELIDLINANKYDSKEKGSDSTSTSVFVPSIKLENVYYSYPETKNYALRNVNIEINPGEIIGLVGKSGSGKSTLVNLILGMFPPSEGKVGISNESLAACIKKFPGLIGYVPQDVFITPGSLRENLTLGLNPNSIKEERLYRALSIAQLDLSKTFTNVGLDFELQELGSNVSGGQRQRIGFARALVTNPKLIVLDEATSSLDTGTESLITQELNNLPDDITMIIVAHRLATLEFVNRIIELDDGEVVFDGEYLEWINGKTAEMNEYFE